MTYPPGTQPTDEHGRLLCLECHQPYRLLAPHLARAHGMDTAAYRETHQLPRTLSLRSADLSQRARTQGRERYQQRPDIRATLEAGRTTAPEAGAVASSQETARRPMVIAVRRRGGQAKAAARDRRMTKQAQSVGFADIDAYLAARQGTSVSAMARELGVPRTTVRAWRERAAGTIEEAVESTS